MHVLHSLLPAFLCLCTVCWCSATEYDYGMVIDAGSTHSKLFVYEFQDRVTSSNVPPQSSPEQVAESSSLGPIGKLASQSECDTLISSLLQYAKATLAGAEDRWNTFPVYLKATAGMRILSVSRREEILAFISASFANSSINPFMFDTTYAIIASGEEEATFDWIGVNFLFGRLQSSESEETGQTFGALDLGGQSTQIAFAPQPNSNILADFTAVRMWQETHRLYTHSFLQYGTDAVADRIAQLSYEAHIANGNSDDTPVYNPCLNNGANDTFTVQVQNNDTEVQMMQFGSSKNDLSQCWKYARNLIVKNATCFVEDCGFNGVYLAEIPSDMTFVAFSAFGYVTEALNLSSTVDLGTIHEIAVDICNMTFDELQASKYHTQASNGFLSTYCRAMTYIYVLLHEGYGFPLTDTPIRFGTKSDDGKEITWTQGSILRDSNWLPYTLDIDPDNNGAASTLSDAGKTWRVLAISFMILFILQICGLVFVVYRYRRRRGDLYRQFAQ